MNKAILESDSLSADETKQLEEMRAQDSQPQESIDIEEPKISEQVAEEPKKEEQEKNKFVPHAALEEERQRRKAAEKEREELRIEQAKVNERLRLINEMMEKKAAPQKVEIPDPDKDALGALKHLGTTTQEEIRILKEFKERTESNQRAALQLNESAQRAAALEREFMATTPDYNDASSYLLNSRHNELMNFGYTPEQIRNIIMQETIALSDQAQQLGRNPAQMVYEIAKSRGYTKKESNQANTQNNADKLSQISAGQKANQSLTDIPGNAPGASKTAINAKDLATMTDAQFAKVLANLDPDQMRSVFGA